MFFWDRIKKLEERVKELEMHLKQLQTETRIKDYGASILEREIPVSEVVKLILERDGLRLRYVYSSGSHFELEKKPEPH